MFSSTARHLFPSRRRWSRDMPNGYIATKRQLCRFEVRHQAEISLANAWVGINHAGSKVDLRR